MFKTKVAILTAAATFALVAPSLAQNLQGFGAPAQIVQDEVSAPAHHKPVALKTKKHVKTVR